MVTEVYRETLMLLGRALAAMDALGDDLAAAHISTAMAVVQRRAEDGDRLG